MNDDNRSDPSYPPCLPPTHTHTHTHTQHGHTLASFHAAVHSHTPLNHVQSRAHTLTHNKPNQRCITQTAGRWRSDSDPSHSLPPPRTHTHFLSFLSIPLSSLSWSCSTNTWHRVAQRALCDGGKPMCALYRSALSLTIITHRSLSLSLSLSISLCGAVPPTVLVGSGRRVSNSPGCSLSGELWRWQRLLELHEKRAEAVWMNSEAYVL